ncbi:MAG: hypothetical protein AAGF45_11515 [Pseudomonadota bacterium]
MSEPAMHALRYSGTNVLPDVSAWRRTVPVNAAAGVSLTEPTMRNGRVCVGRDAVMGSGA